MQSKARTVAEYLDELTPQTRRIIEEMRRLILANLQEGFVETVNWGMLCYEIPLERYPVTYNKQPLMYCALTAQKRHNAIYLMNLYAEPGIAESLQGRFAAQNKKADMGKSCIRFKTTDDVVLDAIADVIGKHSVQDFIAIYEAGRKK